MTLPLGVCLEVDKVIGMLDWFGMDCSVWVKSFKVENVVQNSLIFTSFNTVIF